MIKVYGCDVCKDCVKLKAILKEHHKCYEYINIFESTSNLKEFLRIRDNSNLFDSVKKLGNIGIPLIVFSDGKMTLDYENLDLKSLEEGEENIVVGKNCNIKTGRC